MMKCILPIALITTSLFGCSSTTEQPVEAKQQPIVEIEIRPITLTEEQMKELGFDWSADQPTAKTNNPNQGMDFTW